MQDDFHLPVVENTFGILFGRRLDEEFYRGQRIANRVRHPRGQFTDDGQTFRDDGLLTGHLQAGGFPPPRQ